MAGRSAGGGTVLASGIRTRERKERKLYSDDWAVGDEDIEGHHTFDLDDKLTTSKFNLNFVKDLAETEYNIEYLQKNGFAWPLLFKEKKSLDIVIPDQTFSLNDVRLAVGSRRMLDVMDVNTQKNVEMTMKDWQRYYESKDKDKLLNVISLEFSHTRLEHQIEPPSIVKKLDWVEQVWPRHLKEAQTESTNVLEDMMYPKVQKYCLMSVKGCYTDFHIDFGGTSVWYHILKGEKIFWLIPPSEKNLNLYTHWVLSGKQSDVFFGDTVEKCARVELKAGNTFFIPTGWIHAVYTPEDSLVFGGNFLHSFGIEKQLKVAMVEDSTRVPQKFRYPFFTEMLWYLLERYVHILLNRTHLVLPPEEQEKYDKSVAVKENNNETQEEKHLTQFELHGLKAIVMYLHALPTSKKCVPDLIKDPIALVRDVRTIVEQHRYDSPEKAATNQPILQWWKREASKFTYKRPSSDGPGFAKKRRCSLENYRTPAQLPPNAAKIRHRRVRCKVCEACVREDCRQCIHCLDMSKYGGGGTMKQTCKLKKCLQPTLPAAAICYLCQLDGWLRKPTVPAQKALLDRQNRLMECSVCYKISHPDCMAGETKDDTQGIKAEDTANTWECPECIVLGYNKEQKYQKQAASGRGSSAGSDFNQKSPTAFCEMEEKIIKEETEEIKEDATSHQDAEQNGKLDENLDTKEQPEPRMPTWDELQARVNYPLVKPKWIVRPAATVEDMECENDTSHKEENLALNKTVIRSVFKYLSVNELFVAMQVCRKWAKFSINPDLWKNVSLIEARITPDHLTGIVRRQPVQLILDWAYFSADQFEWLLARIPALQSLSLKGLSWGEIFPLTSPFCPGLTKLDIGFCEGIGDGTLSSLLSPPKVHRPGHRDALSRLRNLTHLSIAGSRITDKGILPIATSLPYLINLDISDCDYITEEAIAILVLPASVICHSLTHLDIRGCDYVSPLCLPSLKKFPLMIKLLLHPCRKVPLKAIEVWAASNSYNVDPETSTLSKPVAIKEVRVKLDSILNNMKKRKSSPAAGGATNELVSNLKRSFKKTRKSPTKLDANTKTKAKITGNAVDTDLHSAKEDSPVLETSKNTRRMTRRSVPEHSKKPRSKSSILLARIDSNANASDSDSNQKNSTCRRSERGNKRGKTKPGSSKNRHKRSKAHKNSSRKSADEDDIASEEDASSSSADDKYFKKATSRRRKSSKDILTRSKKERTSAPTVDDEKEASTSQKSKSEKATKTATLKNQPKSKPNLRAVRKETVVFKTKLRNKPHEPGCSSSSGSSPEVKGRRRSAPVSEVKSINLEGEGNAGEDFSDKLAQKAETGDSSKKIAGTLTHKKRKEKKDPPLQPASGTKTPKADSTRATKGDASSRDRPERSHRSPRRLSLN